MKTRKLLALVLALLIWVAIRYRRAAHPVASKTAHNTVIEVLWTALPVVTIYLMVQLADLIKCVLGFALIKRGVWLNNMVL